MFFLSFCSIGFASLFSFFTPFFFHCVCFLLPVLNYIVIDSGLFSTHTAHTRAFPEFPFYTQFICKFIQSSCSSIIFSIMSCSSGYLAYVLSLSFQPLISPKSNSFVSATGSDTLAVRAPVNTVDLVLMARQIRCKLACPHVPHLEGCVLGRSNEQP